MQGYGLAFEHFGLATRNAPSTLGFLRGIGYTTPEVVHDPLQRVNLVMCRHASMPAVEVIFSDGGPGPLDAILAQQSQAIYHLCYRSVNLDASLSAMRAAGHRFTVVSPPTKAVLFGGHPVSFYLVRGFGLIEILEVES
jgi:methylmalonyl-CoA/ethylmalonyl-CoA epimerase